MGQPITSMSLAERKFICLNIELLIHKADPQSIPVVITVFKISQSKTTFSETSDRYLWV